MDAEATRGMNDEPTAAVLGVAREILSDLDLDRVLTQVVDAARKVTGARFAALGVLDASRTRLGRFITSGMDDETRAAIGAPPSGRGVLGELITNPVPLRLADIGSHAHSYGFPIAHPPMKTFLGVPILIRGEAFGNLYLTEKQGAAEFSAEDQTMIERLAEFAALAIDHAQRFGGSEARRQELEQIVAALDATLQIARALGGQTDLDAILELVAKRGRALVSARALIIEHLSGNKLVVAAAAGELPADLVGQELDLAESVAHAALSASTTQSLDNELTRLRFDRHGLGRLGFEANAGLVVPLLFRGEGYGVLVAVDRTVDGPSFTSGDQALLEAFAASAAAAIATAQTVAEERRRQRLAAAEEERRRWARELHDETLQALAALRLRLTSAQRIGTPEATAAAIDDAVEQVESEIGNLRALVTELRPAALDELGIAAALEALAERARDRGLDVDMSIDLHYEAGRDSTRLLGELETAIYRITQEALTNAQKHGEAKHAVVEVHEGDASVTVVVRDDGLGFDPGQSTNGFGLLGMRERAQLLGGTVTVSSEPAAGTLVRAELPVARRSPRSGSAAGESRRARQPS